MKTFHNLLKLFIIVKLELLKISKISKKLQPEVSEHCWYLAASAFTLF